MTIKKYTNKITEIVFTIAFGLICLYLSGFSLLFVGIIPVLYALVFFNQGLISFILATCLSFTCGLLFVDKSELIFGFIPLVAIGLLFAILIRLKISSKKQILFSFIAISMIFIFLFKYKMVLNDLSIKSLAASLKELVEKSYSYRFDDAAYQGAIAMYPSAISIISMIYAIIAVKVIRNYLSYGENGYSDIKNLDQLRIGKLDLLALILSVAAIYFIGKFLGIKEQYLISNLIAISMLIFAINGLSLFDNIIKNSNLPLSRAFQWFFMIILLQVLIVPLIIFGIVDIFVDFRSRRKHAKQ